MLEATYVAFVPNAKRDKLRTTLQGQDTGELRWREKRCSKGSEFFFTGPSVLARQTRAYVQQWVVQPPS